MSASSKPSKPWRVHGPDSTSAAGRSGTGYRGQRAAYVAVNSIVAAGAKATVYHWEGGRWHLYEVIEPEWRAQYGIRWPTGSVFAFDSREAAEEALQEDGRGVGVLVVHDYVPGTSEGTAWREVRGLA